MAGPARYMLDTNTACFIIRGASAALKNKLRTVPVSSLCISAVTQGELLYGLACKPGATALSTAVQAFLLRVDVLAWNSPAAEHYGQLRASLESQGTPLGNLDTKIAAHALASDCTLVTNDQAFFRVAQLKAEDWTSAAT